MAKVLCEIISDCFKCPYIVNFGPDGWNEGEAKNDYR